MIKSNILPKQMSYLSIKFILYNQMDSTKVVHIVLARIIHSANFSL